MVGSFPRQCCRHHSDWTRGQRYALRAMSSRGDVDRARRSKALRQALQPDHGCRSRHGWNRHHRRRLRGHGDSRRCRVPRARRPCPCLPTSTRVAAAATRVRPLITGPLPERSNGRRSRRQPRMAPAAIRRSRWSSTAKRAARMNCVRLSFATTKTSSITASGGEVVATAVVPGELGQFEHIQHRLGVHTKPARARAPRFSRLSALLIAMETLCTYRFPTAGFGTIGGMSLKFGPVPEGLTSRRSPSPSRHRPPRHRPPRLGWLAVRHLGRKLDPARPG